MSISPGSLSESFFSALRISTATPDEAASVMMSRSPVYPYLDSYWDGLEKKITYQPIMDSARIVTEVFKRKECLQLDLIQHVDTLAKKVILTVQMFESKTAVPFPRGIADLGQFINELVCISSYSFGDLIEEAIDSENLKFTIQKVGIEAFKIRFTEIVQTPTFGDVTPKTPIVSDIYSTMLSKIIAELELLGFSKEEIEENKDLITGSDALLLEEIEQQQKTSSRETPTSKLLLCQAILEKHREILLQRQDDTMKAFERIFSMVETSEPSIDIITLTFKKSVS